MLVDLSQHWFNYLLHFDYKLLQYIVFIIIINFISRNIMSKINKFLEMPVPSQGHYGFHSFPVVD